MAHAAALIVVDVQNDFCPGGALAVPDGDGVVPVANDLMARFDHVILTQDWHPSGHGSFASCHAGATAYDVIEMPYGPQVLWPDHCVQGTDGAAFHRDLDADQTGAVIRKGRNPAIDSYSAFFENDHVTHTGLAGLLRELAVGRLYVCGLALDFCVRYTAEDGAAQGFQVTVIEDACRAIDLDGSLAATYEAFQAAGIPLIESSEVQRDPL